MTDEPPEPAPEETPADIIDAAEDEEIDTEAEVPEPDDTDTEDELSDEELAEEADAGPDGEDGHG